ncbi:MAG: NUDIX hydrolase [bacterium]|nr:NUDIX hydrolase [bacterium]
MLKRRRNPYPTVDVIITSRDHPQALIMVRRKYSPRGWALPGGFINWGESAEAAAVREMREETGLELQDIKQFHVYSDPARDPRGHTMSVVFTATTNGEPVGGDDAAEAVWMDLKSLPPDITFDHRRIIEDWVAASISLPNLDAIPY